MIFYFNVFFNRKEFDSYVFERNVSFMVVLNFGKPSGLFTTAVTVLFFFKDTRKAYFCYRHALFKIMTLSRLFYLL